MSKTQTKHCYTSKEQIINSTKPEKLVVIGHNPPREEFSPKGTVAGKINKLCKELDCGKWELVNLYSVVAPQSDDIYTKFATNKQNRECIQKAINSAKYVVAGWGDKGTEHGIDEEVTKNSTNILYIQLTSKNNPKHIRHWPNTIGLKNSILKNHFNSKND